MKKFTIAIKVFTVFVIATSAYCAAPANDMFADRFTITGTSGTTNGSNVDATLEAGEQEKGSTCTVWWTWTATSSGGCDINTCGSDFDTYLAVFTGNSLGSLALIAENNDSDECGDDEQSQVCFDVTAGQIYQIQVSGRRDDDVGEIVLNWALGGALSDWILDETFTNTQFRIAFASDLSALTFNYIDVENIYYRTNDLGCRTWKDEDQEYNSREFSVTDTKNNKIVENKPFDSLGIYAEVEDYNGKNVLVYDEDSMKLFLFGIKKGVFVKVNEQTIYNFSSARFEGKEIYVKTSDYSSSPTKYGIQVFDKKLKKEKWSDGPAEGRIEVLRKGLTARKNQTGDNLKIICKRKGKKVVSEHDLTEPSDSWISYRFDKKGGIVYWTTEIATDIKSPLTYLDRKGKIIVDNQSMTDVGNFWAFKHFDGKALYVSKEVSRSNYVVYVYKMIGMKKLGQQSINLPKSGQVYTTVNKEVYCITRYFDSETLYAAFVFDKKLKKMKWKEDYAEGKISETGKDALRRYTSNKVGDSVTKEFKLFNKKGEIVTYTFVYTE